MTEGTHNLASLACYLVIWSVREERAGSGKLEGHLFCRRMTVKIAAVTKKKGPVT